MKQYLLVGIFLVFSHCISALSLNQQRQIYTDIIALQDANMWQEAEKKLAVIPTYPLAYLLEYQQLKNDFSQTNVVAVMHFIDKYKQYKISSDLQREYLFYLASVRKWDDFIAFYPQLPRSTDLKCFYFQAHMASGMENEIWPDVQKTWLSPTSQPNACEPVFSFFLANKKISQKHIWRRFELAFDANKKPLMRYLITLMADDDKQLADQLYLLNGSPEKLATSSLFKKRDQKSYPFLIDTIKRLARVDLALAMQVYASYDKKIPFTFKDEIHLKQYFSLRILIGNDSELLPWLDDTLPTLGDAALIEQRIRYAIKYNQWDDIGFWIKQLPDETKQKPVWVYWQARVLESKKQFSEATKLYQKIAAERKYYGFLAAQKLGISYQLNAQLVVPEVSSLRYVQGLLDHIEELNFHQHITLLKREWTALLKGRETDIQRQLGLYAMDKGWAHLSVVASVNSQSWDALNIRFPEAEPELFVENAQKYQLAPSYIYAITRQESSFDEFAKSPVGASGYMQLMPNTASETARKIGMKQYKQIAQLKQGEINVQLGSAYLGSLLKRYNGNRILATAAYNAGPYRVDRWKQNEKGRDVQALSMDSWIEAIPYKETRRYVKNVLSYNVIYQHILDKPMEFFNPTELAAQY